MVQPFNSKLKRLGGFFFVGVVLACAFLYVYFWNKPPKEGELIRNFQAHRASYEKLRDMLKADQQLLRVADWGVETAKAGIIKPPNGGFPVDRYNEYIALLKEVGGKAAYRGRGEYPESVSVLVWASGWAADTKHIQICWFEHSPLSETSIVAQSSKGRGSTFRHIEANWYLWED
jgi:hypothetical protein